MKKLFVISRKICLSFILLLIPSAIFSNINQQYFFERSLNTVDYSDLPQILSEEDLSTYKRIYDLQKRGKYDEAKSLYANLENDLLEPYLLYILYVNTKYVTTYKELQTWLHKYNHLPVSKQVHELAKKKARNRAQRNSLSKPSNYFYKRVVPLYLRHDSFKSSNAKPVLSIQSDKKLVSNSSTRNIQRYLRKGQTLLAKQTLQNPRIKRSLGNYTYTRYAATLSKSYFLDGYDRLAIYWANEASTERGEQQVEALFTAGLAYYRLGQYSDAIRYFYRLANDKSLSIEKVSKASYWYAKTNLNIGNIEEYYKGLNLASEYYYNFYGLLAIEELGLKPKYEWEVIDVSKGNINKLLDYEPGIRAFALLQLGLADWAEQELVSIASDDYYSEVEKDEKDTLDALLYMAQHVNMPALSLRLAGAGGKYHGFSHLAYPAFFIENLVDGYKVDPALLLAIMKRESLFFSAAQSGPGALGIMQVMPTTAELIVRENDLDNQWLFELTSPRVSIELGQRYIRKLLNLSTADNNLVYVLAGYNGGFSNVVRWKKDRHRRVYDPVFFIESIPFYETRGYVKGVITDYWIYQNKIGIPTYSLNLLIHGKGAIYYMREDDILNNVTRFSYGEEEETEEAESLTELVSDTVEHKEPETNSSTST